MVRPLATNPAQKLFFLSFTSAEGKGAPLPFWGPSQSFGFSLFPLPVSGDLTLLSANTWSPLCDPHSFLNGHFFWRLDTVNSNTSSSNFIFLLPVGYHVTVLVWKWTLKTQLDLELIYFKAAVQHFSHYSTGTQFSVQFSISTQFSSISPIDKTLSNATTLGQSGPGSNGNERVICIPQSSSITGASPSDCFVSYPEHLLRESYPSAELQLVYSIAPADWARVVERQKANSRCHIIKGHGVNPFMLSQFYLEQKP